MEFSSHDGPLQDIRPEEVPTPPVTLEPTGRDPSPSPASSPDSLASTSSELSTSSEREVLRAAQCKHTPGKLLYGGDHFICHASTKFRLIEPAIELPCRICRGGFSHSDDFQLGELCFQMKQTRVFKFAASPRPPTPVAPRGRKIQFQGERAVNEETVIEEKREADTRKAIKGVGKRRGWKPSTSPADAATLCNQALADIEQARNFIRLAANSARAAAMAHCKDESISSDLLSRCARTASAESGIILDQALDLEGLAAVLKSRDDVGDVEEVGKRLGQAVEVFKEASVRFERVGRRYGRAAERADKQPTLENVGDAGPGGIAEDEFEGERAGFLKRMFSRWPLGRK